MKFFKRDKNYDYVMYIVLIIFFLFMLFFSSFRDMVKDESLYFNETWLMSQLLQEGRWIGNYAVGLHGFLFKLPMALIFLITGPSVEIVTIFNILLACITGLLFYNLSKKVLGKSEYGVLSTLILLSSFYFFISTPTYLREIPSVFVVVLFLYSLIDNWDKWKMSLIFLLLLDSKEYIFFVFALFYLILLLIESDKKGVSKIVEVLKQYVLIMLPSAVWLVLMFTTSIIPMNMYVVSTLGLIDTNFKYLFSHFNADMATLNLIEGGREMPLIIIKESYSAFAHVIINILNVILQYIGKVLYPRTFSFISVPKVVIFPVIYTSILLVKKYLKSKSSSIRKYAHLSLLLLVWLVIYILRTSHGRYLLPVLPVISILYIYILFKHRFIKKQKKEMVIGTLIFIVLGFLFETSYVVPKILIEVGIFVLFAVSIRNPKLKNLKYLLVVLLSGACVGVSLLFSYTQGQVYGAVNFGKNRQAEQVAKILPNEKYWTNNDINQMLVSVYSNERFSEPQWHWQLHDIVPKKEMLKTLDEKRSFVFEVVSIDKFKKNIKRYNIEKLVLYESKIKEKYTDQEYLTTFMSQDWIELEKKYEFKGLNVYIFNVK